MKKKKPKSNFCGVIGGKIVILVSNMYLLLLSDVPLLQLNADRSPFQRTFVNQVPLQL